MSAPKAKPEVAREFLASLDQIHLVCIHPNGLKVIGREFSTSVDGAVEFAALHNADGLNIYWTVNGVELGTHKKPTKRDITGARFVHVDIDPPKTGGRFDKPAIIGALDSLECPPSIIIDSGGGLQAFWRLDDRHENLAAIEEINRQVRDYFSADNCQNIDRVMRLPGFTNWPDAKKRARGRVPALATVAREDDGIVYGAEEIAAAFPASTGPKTSSGGDRASIDLPSGWEAQTPDSLGLGPLDPLREMIAAPAGSDRSSEGLACARHMAFDGYTDAEIMGVLLNAANAVAAHFLDQKDALRAVRRVIGLVRADGPENPTISHRFVSVDIDEIRRRLEERMVVKAEAKPAPMPEAAPTGEDPQWLVDLGNGALAQFVRHVTSTAASPQPWLTLGAAIAMFGVIAGRRYAGPTNLRTNVYSIGVADSGGGKDHPLRMTVRLMIEAGLADHVGGSKIASGQGLITAVKRAPSVLFPIDEIGFLIAAAADKRRSPKHVTDIMDNLTEFYSLAGSTFMGTVYANDEEKPREVIEQPCLGIFGVTTPGVFWGSLSSGNVLDGSLARMVVFESDTNYPDPQHDLAVRAWPETLVKAATLIAAGAEGHAPFPLGVGPVQAPKPYTVPYADNEASSFAREMREIQTRQLRQHEGTQMTGIIARMAENAAKIALIKAITDNPKAPAITVADQEWGLMVARRSVDTLMRAVDERVADSEAEAKLKRVLRVVAGAGSDGIGAEELGRKCRFMGSRRQLNEALDFLIDGGDVLMNEADVERSGAATGRKRRTYFAA
jgi:hypothetical protein